MCVWGEGGGGVTKSVLCIRHLQVSGDSGD